MALLIIAMLHSMRGRAAAGGIPTVIVPEDPPATNAGAFSATFFNETFDI